MVSVLAAPDFLEIQVVRPPLLFLTKAPVLRPGAGSGQQFGAAVAQWIEQLDWYSGHGVGSTPAGGANAQSSIGWR